MLTSPLRSTSADAAVPDAPAPPSATDADQRWLYRILAFAAELRGSLSSHELYALVASKVPELAGIDDLSIETVVDERRQMLAPAPSANPAAARAILDAPGEWATFPLPAGTGVVGVLRVGITGRPLSPASRRTLATVAPMIGEALATAHSIERLRELSTVDSVTGCATRQEGLNRLRAELKRAHRTGQHVAVLMLDLDYFKSINDRYGHQCGDLVLGSIGRTIMQALRVSDIRSRWGGEEFLVALPDTALEQARRAALALARRIAATVTEFDSARIQLTASIGITIAEPGEDDPEPVLVRADAALYRAKADGRNCIRTLLPDGTGGAAVAAAPPPPLPFRDRRNPDRSDRRRPPGPGRRTTDAVPLENGSLDTPAQA